MRAKEGFSVVAPMRITEPLSTKGSSESCWTRVKPVDLVDEHDGFPMRHVGVAGHLPDLLDA